VYDDEGVVTLNLSKLITKATESLAARAMMSAQETLFVHCGSASTAAFTWAIVLYPSSLRNVFSPDCRSLLFVLLSKIDASQP
jgi:hypothetical protein